MPDDEILAAIPELARLAGVFAEPAAACAWACLKKMAREKLVRPDERVVCLITGNGLKDVASAREGGGRAGGDRSDAGSGGRRADEDGAVTAATA